MVGMSMSIGLRLEQRMEQRMVITLPHINWSLVDAFKDEGDEPPIFKKKQLDVIGMKLEERLAAVDKENEVFRFSYTQAESDQGKKGRYYRIPLMRDNNVDIDEIAIPITKQEYERAAAILHGAGRFQRIARAVPYMQLHEDVKEFVERHGCSLDDVVIIGVDRGGRLPSFIMREALGKEESYTLKVDQSGGHNGGLDLEKLEELTAKGVMRDRFVLFVDSTVDSGRQIDVLRRYFDNDEWRTKTGHKNWGVMGSNEEGLDLPLHRNINWGLNPDEAFEDRPELMGVDYAPGNYCKVVDCPSQTSEAIKAALLEVPKGIVLDLTGIEDILKAQRAHRQTEDIIYSSTWQNCAQLYWSEEMKDLKATLITPVIAVEEIAPRKTLLIVGSGRKADITDAEAQYIAASLNIFYDAIAGTSGGNPGKVLEHFSKIRHQSAQLYHAKDADDERENREMFGNQIIFTGENKIRSRKNMVDESDALLVLSGGEGTLHEVILGLTADKPTYIIRDYGAVGTFANKSRLMKKFQSLHLMDDLPEAVEELQYQWAKLD